MNYTTVYSTDRPICKKCRQIPCTCVRNTHGTTRQAVRILRETKGRKGAGVTVVTGLAMTSAELKARLTLCKKGLVCGGRMRGDVLEFQGEHRDA